MLSIALALWAATAGACEELRLPEPLILDPEMIDDTPPSRPEVLDVYVDFALADSGCDDPCPDRVLLTVWFDETQDDQTPSDQLGYQVRILEGDVPEGVVVPTEPFIGPTAEFVWPVDRRIATQGVRIIFELRTVDLAGNVSTGAIEIDVDQPAVWIPFVSCDHTGGGGMALLSLGLVAIRRRRSA